MDIQVGQVVILQKCAYAGCPGAVVGAYPSVARPETYEVSVPGLGTVMRGPASLRPPTDDELSGEAEVKTPNEWMLERDIGAFTAALQAAAANGDDALAEAYADAIIDREARLQRCREQGEIVTV